MASSGEVARVYAPDGALLGWQAVGEVRRAADGAMLAKAEGFVGLDEQKWGGGGPKNLPPSAEYACRAMAQTRAISRACRSAFAHVVVMIDAGLSTTPAEEVPDGGFEHEQPKAAPKATATSAKPAAHTNGEAASTLPLASDAQRKALHTALSELGIKEADRKVWCSTRLHRKIESSKELLAEECSLLITIANKEIDAAIASASEPREPGADA
jgi:hypothetical protein